MAVLVVALFVAIAKMADLVPFEAVVHLAHPAVANLPHLRPVLSEMNSASRQVTGVLPL